MRGGVSCSMRLRFLFCLWLLLSSVVCHAMFPQDGAVLHYRMIGFRFDAYKGATGYRLEIYNFNNDPSANALGTPIISKDGGRKIVATVPAFGRRYMWRVLYMNGSKVLYASTLYFFTVSKNPFSNDTVARVLVTDSAAKYSDMLVFFDNTRTLYNMRGEALWYVPEIPGVSDSSAGVLRDIKLSPAGTITFLTKKNVHEIDYNGRVLWSGPNNGKVSGNAVEDYHHEFTRLHNGHYMVIGNKFVPDKTTAGSDSSGHVKTTSCGCVIEYNSKGQVVWLWNSCDHIGLGDPTTHFNSFYLDEKRKLLYTSYRNISRIVKAAYPGGKVLAQYGQVTKAGSGIQGNDMFYAQHNCGVNSDGNLTLFNNNFKMDLPKEQRNENNCMPSVLVLKEPVKPGDTVRKLWEYPCGTDPLTDFISSSGGTVWELDKGDYLVCQGLPGRSFIVSKDKKILWKSISQQNEGGTWKPYSIYRISPVRRAQIDKLVFGG